MEEVDDIFNEISDMKPDLDEESDQNDKNEEDEYDTDSDNESSGAWFETKNFLYHSYHSHLL